MVAFDRHPGFPEVSCFYNLVYQFHLLLFVLLVNILAIVPTTSNLERLRFFHLGYTSFADCASIAYSDLHYIYINPFSDGESPNMGSADSHP